MSYYGVAVWNYLLKILFKLGLSGGMETAHAASQETSPSKFKFLFRILTV